MTTTITRNRRSRLLALLATPALLLALAGCMPGGTDTGDGPDDGQPTTSAELDAARDAYDLELAQCFRDKGFDVKDPLPGTGITENSPELQAAYPACAEEIGDPPSSAGVTASPEELALNLARATCLRELGYEIQEPTADDPGFIPAEVTEEHFEKCQY